MNFTDDPESPPYEEADQPGVASTAANVVQVPPMADPYIRRVDKAANNNSDNNNATLPPLVAPGVGQKRPARDWDQEETGPDARATGMAFEYAPPEQFTCGRCGQVNDSFLAKCKKCGNRRWLPDLGEPQPTNTNSVVSPSTVILDRSKCIMFHSWPAYVTTEKSRLAFVKQLVNGVGVLNKIVGHYGDAENRFTLEFTTEEDAALLRNVNTEKLTVPPSKEGFAPARVHLCYDHYHHLENMLPESWICPECRYCNSPPEIRGEMPPMSTLRCCSNCFKEWNASTCSPLGVQHTLVVMQRFAAGKKFRKNFINSLRERHLVDDRPDSPITVETVNNNVIEFLYVTCTYVEDALAIRALDSPFVAFKTPAGDRVMIRYHQKTYAGTHKLPVSQEDWICGSCGDYNRWDQHRCFKCKTMCTLVNADAAQIPSIAMQPTMLLQVNVPPYAAQDDGAAVVEWLRGVATQAKVELKLAEFSLRTNRTDEGCVYLEFASIEDCTAFRALGVPPHDLEPPVDPRTNKRGFPVTVKYRSRLPSAITDRIERIALEKKREEERPFDPAWTTNEELRTIVEGLYDRYDTLSKNERAFYDKHIGSLATQQTVSSPTVASMVPVATGSPSGPGPSKTPTAAAAKPDATPDANLTPAERMKLKLAQKKAALAGGGGASPQEALPPSNAGPSPTAGSGATLSLKERLALKKSQLKKTEPEGDVNNDGLTSPSSAPSAAATMPPPPGGSSKPVTPPPVGAAPPTSKPLEPLKLHCGLPIPPSFDPQRSFRQFSFPMQLASTLIVREKS